MSPIQYVTGDATEPQGAGPKVIVHCCNDLGKWGRGFVLALSARFPGSETWYRTWARKNRGFMGEPPVCEVTGPFALGQAQFVLVRPRLWVANIIGQHGIVVTSEGVPIRYGAIRSGLAHVRKFSLPKGASVHMPRMGAGLAGGDWDRVAEIVTEELVNHKIPVTVYDIPVMGSIVGTNLNRGHDRRYACTLAGDTLMPRLSQEPEMQIKPLFDQIAVKVVAYEPLSEDATKVRQACAEGQVLAVGPGAYSDSGAIRKMVVRVGDRVLFPVTAGHSAKIGAEECVLLSEEDILALIVKP